MPTIELFGVPRLLAGVPSVETAGRTIRQCLLELEARQAPLAGRILIHGGLSPAYRVCINGQRFVDSIDLEIKPDDAILILSADLGG